MGINRNKIAHFQTAKLNGIKKKNRFKMAGKDDDDLISGNPKQMQNHNKPTHYSPTQPKTPATRTLTAPRSWSCMTTPRKTLIKPTK